MAVGICEWDVDGDLEYYIPTTGPGWDFHRNCTRRNTANAERMLAGTCPHSLLALDDIREDYDPED